MPFIGVGDLRYYKFSNLEGFGLYHAVFTRQGGVSPPPWDSLNFGASVGDEMHRVNRNRQIALETVNIPTNSVYDLHQVHSTEVVVTDKPLSPNESHIKADGILTNTPKVTLMMRFADCVPILLFDPEKRSIGIVHSGWIGTVNKIVKRAVLKMVEVYGTKPSDLIAAIGPSIGPDHYSVGKDVVAHIYSSFDDNADQYLVTKQGKTYFDLWKANKNILIEAGVQNVEISGLCTYCNLTDWYSHRGEHGRTGRFGLIFGLRE